MKLYRYLFLLLFFPAVFSCEKINHDGEENKVAEEEQFTGTKQSGITYQLLVYTFADSDGDGVGDFNGIAEHLDYLDGLGVTALWLSPIHPAVSYHGYDVKDYNAINPAYGTEQDFRNLLSLAHGKGIKIYLDYVLNHSSIEHPWFKDAVANASGSYRDYYVLSDNPAEDIASGKIPMIATEGASGYEAAQWYVAPGQTGLGAKGRFKFSVDWSDADKPMVTVSNSSDAPLLSNPDNSVMKFLYFGKEKLYRLYDKGGDVFETVVDFDSDWGFLLRTSDTKWDGGTKFGAPSGGGPVKMGQPYRLTNASNCTDCVFKSALQYHSHFWTGYFADFNYGPSSQASNSGAFKALAATADKWIAMGVDGFRLDAVKHIYHNANSNENPDFLKQWYDRCNTAYRAAGHTDNIYMVGEQYSGAGEVAPYYKGLPALFEFDFWNRLEWAINNGTGRYFVKDITGYHNSYENFRPGAIAATKLSNHDEDRAASRLGRNPDKIRLAACVLLTSGGQPYIYQGEELGYWGTKSGGDEFVRTPILWDASGRNLAKNALNGKIDMAMLTPDISVESQLKDENSILRLYRKLGRLRNTYPAIARGEMSRHPVYNEDNADYNAIAAWYMTNGTDKMLVIHNLGKSDMQLPLAESVEATVFLNGSAGMSGKNLNLGAYSSAVLVVK
jgi:hypothetical protein